MEQTRGLAEYIGRREYREALGLPQAVSEEYRLLAQGEYNRNYLFTHPCTKQKLLLRVNFGSQMHLENQIEYEYRALQLLQPSRRTPTPLYVDGTKQYLPYGMMVMEYLPGHALDYETELPFAADCLADIHSVPIGAGAGLIAPAQPLRAILEECETMFCTYAESELADARKKQRIQEMLAWGRLRAGSLPEPPYRCCINTELNSTNFLINGAGKPNCLIDWEKPLYGDPAQDLGHFLAPTTTFWKTDIILSRDRMERFTELYLERVADRFDTTGLWARTQVYIPITCLRGITWCAMAWVEYKQPEKAIFNASTFHKLEAYLSDDFLERIAHFIGL